MTRKIITRMLCLPLMLGASMSFAQQRHCDMAVTLLNPQEGDVIAPYATFDVRVNVENLGPDTLNVGDTLYYNLPTELSIQYDPYVLTQVIEPGQNADLMLASITNVNDNQENMTADFCVKVRSNLNGNGPFADTSISNNYSCHSVTFGATNSIEDVNEAKTTFVISPNPATNQVLLTIKKSGVHPQSLRIFGLDGRMVKSVTMGKGQTSVHIPIADLASGAYFLDVMVQGRHLAQKFIKQ